MYLKNENVHYWDKWADEKGDLGPVYGKQLMEWDCGYFNVSKNDILERATVNQIQNIINTLRTNPDDRRLVFSMWNPGELNDMALPPCHWGGEFYSEPLEMVNGACIFDGFKGLVICLLGFLLISAFILCFFL